MKIYTRTGDLGETALFAGPRVGKDMPRIEVCGAIDELNAAIGIVRAKSIHAEVDRILDRIQNELFAIGAELATIDPVAKGLHWISPENVKLLEDDIDRYQQSLPPLDWFILPGGTPAAASLHLARAICRRAERRLVTLVRHSEEPISLVLIAYLNRASDLLFVLARYVNSQSGRPDVAWKKPASAKSPE